MESVIIAAVARNGVIGVEGRLPWRIPEDMARFQRLTMGNVLVMGRATFESIGRPLEGRLNVVLTNSPGWEHEGVIVCRSLGDAVEVASKAGVDCYIGGGAGVYQEALDTVDRMELTEVDAEPEGDTRFPTVDWSHWEEVERQSHDGFDFVTYERAESAST